MEILRDIVKIIFQLSYICINTSIFILGAFFLKTAITRTPHLVDPPEKYLFGFYLLDSPIIKKATARIFFIKLYYILGIFLIIASIYMLIFIVTLDY
jgi:hypothetical protein